MRSRLTTLLERPALAILALTIACLVAFAVTLPLPRVDDQLIGSDGTRYYVYLPSLWIDGDLDFTDEYGYFYRSHPQTAAYLIHDRTPAGLPANRFGIGPAILWSPFFLAAHLLAVLARAAGGSLAADGTGAFYQAPVLAGSILYGGLGAWLCFRTALRVASQKAALAATLGVVLAGNAIYYLTVEPSMSHPLSMFASAALFYVWVTSRNRAKDRQPIALGGLAGLMALIRPQDGLFLLLPIADGALSVIAGRDSWRRWLGSSLRMIATALLVFLPQLAVWHLLNGGFLRSGYGEEFGVLFHSPLPNLLAVLFSAQRGLFTWHPVFLLAVAGLWLLARHGALDQAELRPGGAVAMPPRRGAVATLGLVGIAIQWLVISSWRQWTQGDAFGGRMFIVCTPIFVFGLAYLLDRVARRWPWRRIVAGGALLVALNFLLLVHYRVELIYRLRPITFMDLACGRFALS